MCMVAAWDDSEASQTNQHIGWTRACWRALEPFASSGVYVNFLSSEGEGRVRASYRAKYERLVALKNRYDPTNFFSLNQNIASTNKEVYQYKLFSSSKSTESRTSFTNSGTLSGRKESGQSRLHQKMLLSCRSREQHFLIS